ncbi:hypothetical protein PR048_030113 [Dryococelus australis]|uniref:Uncharacterized protein n=1 Tax=Dryococelus australis TaxID=614101 RepID=A0ABQ9G814_9NEOP|nr:hypothetical protein PR048_030113 [Dryococelus australis]
MTDENKMAYKNNIVGSLTWEMPMRWRHDQAVITELPFVAASTREECGTEMHLLVSSNNVCLRRYRDRGGLVVRLLASHLSEQGSIPDGIVPNEADNQRVFSGDLLFSPSLHSSAAPYSPRFIPIGSRDLGVKSRQNLSTPLLYITASGQYVEISSPKTRGLQAIRAINSTQYSEKGKRRQGLINGLAALGLLPSFVLVARESGLSFNSRENKELGQTPACLVQKDAYKQMADRKKVARVSEVLTLPRSGVVVRLHASHLGKPSSIPDVVAHGFLYIGIVPGDAAGQRVFSGISRFPHPCIMAPLHTHFTGISKPPFECYAGNTARLARRSDEALGVRVTIARIAPSFLDLAHIATYIVPLRAAQISSLHSPPLPRRRTSGHEFEAGSTAAAAMHATSRGRFNNKQASAGGGGGTRSGVLPQPAAVGSRWDDDGGPVRRSREYDQPSATSCEFSASAVISEPPCSREQKRSEISPVARYGTRIQIFTMPGNVRPAQVYWRVRKVPRKKHDEQWGWREYGAERPAKAGRSRKTKIEMAAICCSPPVCLMLDLECHDELFSTFNPFSADLTEPRWSSGQTTHLPPSRRTWFYSRRGPSPPPKLGFSHVGIASDDASGRRVFSGTSHFPRPCIPALLHTHLASPSLTLKTSMSKSLPNRSPFHSPAMILFTVSGVANKCFKGNDARKPHLTVYAAVLRQLTVYAAVLRQLTVYAAVLRQLTFCAAVLRQLTFCAAVLSKLTFYAAFLRQLTFYAAVSRQATIRPKYALAIRPSWVGR